MGTGRRVQSAEWWYAACDRMGGIILEKFFSRPYILTPVPGLHRSRRTVRRWGGFSLAFGSAAQLTNPPAAHLI